MTLRRKSKYPTPTPGWAVYLRTSDEEAQNPEASQARQRYIINKSVLDRSDLPVIDEYKDVLTGRNPQRVDYQRMLQDARIGKFSHVVVERADRFGRNDTEALRAIDELDEFGVSVRFANQPDLNPMDADDRIIVALSFTLARRESILSGLRIRGAAETKRAGGGFVGRVPDGFISVEDEAPGRKSYAKKSHHIEQDPERAKIWRLAWDLLLGDKLTLEEIAEELHIRGYHYCSGRPFVEVKSNGKRKAHYNTMSYIFHNWIYAGWIVNVEENILPKTLRGNWEPIVTTEEFEKGLAILERRQSHRVVRRRHDYLLKGLIYVASPGEESLHKLTGSTSNASRAGGGTAYYCVPRSDINLPCSDIDAQIPMEMMRIQVNPDLLPAIRSCYTQDIAQKLGHLRPDERTELEAALKSIDEEEARMARLFAAGKITEAIWDNLWAEWQDRRRTLRSNLESMGVQQDYHVNNLDVALKIIAKVGLLYNSLERSDQKELLRLMVEKVVVDLEGKVRLELRPPFAYLHELSERVRCKGGVGTDKTKASECAGCSDWILDCGSTRIRT
jgi:DNA invertase Pin-like site-specific DNA recombinase